MKHTSAQVADSVVSVVNPSGQAGDAIDARSADLLSISNVITVDANAAKTFATGAIGTNQITITAHGYKTGLVGQFTTTVSLPTGLSTSTNYFVVVVDANTVSFATTYAHAAAGTLVTFTASGASGTGTFTPTALATCSVTPQWSNDKTNWYNLTTATNITTSTTFGYPQSTVPYNYVRLNYAIASGSLTVANTTQTFVNKS